MNESFAMRSYLSMSRERRCKERRLLFTSYCDVPYATCQPCEVNVFYRVNGRPGRVPFTVMRSIIVLFLRARYVCELQTYCQDTTDLDNREWPHRSSSGRSHAYSNFFHSTTTA